MVQMDFDIGNSGRSHLGERIEIFRGVFLLRIEKRVLRRSAAGVRMPGCDLRPSPPPRRDPVPGDLRRWLVPERLEMIADRQPNRCGRGESARGRREQSGTPDLKVAGELHAAGSSGTDPEAKVTTRAAAHRRA
jgi:hypothetical protein